MVGRSIQFLSIISRSPTDTKKYFAYLIIGSALLWLGMIPHTGFPGAISVLFSISIDIVPLYVHSTILVATGAILILITITRVEVFSLTDWKDNLQELYVISQMPTHYQKILYHINFLNDPSFSTPNTLISGGILGLEQVLTNFSDLGTHVKVVEQEETDILLEHRPMYVVCLIVRYKLKIHEKILALIVQKFSKFYDNVLPSMDFSHPFTTTIFNGFDKQVKKILNDINM